MADRPKPLLPPGPQPIPFSNPVTIEFAQRWVVMHQVADYELDDLVSGNASLYWTFFGISFGACLSLISVLYSIPVQNPKAYATFFALCVLFGFLSAVFLPLGITAYFRVRRKVKTIKRNRATLSG
jgi:hypothetical protein